MQRIHPLTPESYRCLKEITPWVMGVALLLIPMTDHAAHNDEDGTGSSADLMRSTWEQNVLGPQLVQRYNELLSANLAAAANSSESQVNDPTGLTVARRLEAKKLQAELELLRLQLQYVQKADTSPDRILLSGYQARIKALSSLMESIDVEPFAQKMEDPK